MPQSLSTLQGAPGQPHAQVQVTKVEYLESVVGTDTVVVLPVVVAWLDCAALVRPVTSVNSEVIGAIEDTWDGDADALSEADKAEENGDEVLCTSDELEAVSMHLK